ncbi:oligosaccaryltransferase family protein [Rhodotorula toruloides NP11]|uniref:Oligosaccaryltransferase family protein n=1 Tax=Rhodotorula toruloides (strain NP11) TaxID=1130832 RepID=M7XPZ1_RHOT1|nr:oligosaccaryltransferase family protein [Rhodotorula toruloides NP11]EMS25999.1 oligosaccaryltransferase family protein [Rhodotorula toruloides NP11]
MSPISDTLLTTLANGFGTLAVVGIVVYQFLEINAKRELSGVKGSDWQGISCERTTRLNQDRLAFASPVKTSSKTTQDTQQ